MLNAIRPAALVTAFASAVLRRLRDQAVCGTRYDRGPLLRRKSNFDQPDMVFLIDFM
jgi:hypothetical protein